MSNLPAVPTREEIELIREYCFMPMMLNVVENNRRKIEYSSETLKPLYLKATDVLMKKIHDDLTVIRKQLKAIGCKVEEVDKYERAALHYEFWLRGYHHEFSLLKEMVRAEISVRLSKYIAGVFK